MKKTLASAEKQTLAKEQFEVLVVDDGSSDGTREFMEKEFVADDLVWSYFFNSHGGPAKARNLGLEKARGEIIFFCGDDTFPQEDLLTLHQEHHKKKSGTALLGLALWDETEPISDFMHYLAPAGPQFHYNTINDKTNAGFEHFYTCNISLAKSWLKEEQFDEIFENGAFEDIELGLRLERKGLKIFFEEKAKVFHSHFYSEEDFAQRMEKVGKAVVIFLKKYEKEKKIKNQLQWQYAPFLFFPGIKIFCFFSQLLAKSAWLKKINPRWHWFWRICLSYAKGIKKMEKWLFNK